MLVNAIKANRFEKQIPSFLLVAGIPVRETELETKSDIIFGHFGKELKRPVAVIHTHFLPQFSTAIFHRK